MPVEGTLLSANPITVSVFSGQTSFVTFQFQTTGIPLTFGPGTIDIGIDVSTCDPMPPPGVELNLIANTDFEANADGWSAFDGTISLSDVAHCGRHSAEISFSDVENVVPPVGHIPGLPTFGAQCAVPDVPTPYKFTYSAWVRHDGPGLEGVGYALLERCEQSSELRDLASGGDAVEPNTWVRLTGTVQMSPTLHPRSHTVVGRGWPAPLRRRRLLGAERAERTAPHGHRPFGSTDAGRGIFGSGRDTVTGATAVGIR